MKIIEQEMMTDSTGTKIPALRIKETEHNLLNLKVPRNGPTAEGKSSECKSKSGPYKWAGQYRGEIETKIM